MAHELVAIRQSEILWALKTNTGSHFHSFVNPILICCVYQNGYTSKSVHLLSNLKNL